ncbi:MAG: tRNA (adenosine(37)-N6)-dimethylallyltransferase MiaA [Acidobacteriota bacterium]
MTDLVVVVVGPTAAGKTTLGASLAEKLGGEVVSADAFAVYRGLDIGTAKPGRDELDRVPHHLIDIADPRERYSAGTFLRDADAAIVSIRRRGRVPVVVGGTLFYVRALLWGLFPEPARDLDLRRDLEEAWARDPEECRRRLAVLDPAAAVRLSPGDRQRILRTLEVATLTGRPMTELWHEHPRRQARYRFVMLGLRPPRAELHARIATRTEGMFAAGLLAEVEGLLADGVPTGAHALKAIGYRECCRVLEGAWSLETAVNEAAAATRRLAKRQMTWLRGEGGVEWLGEGGDAGLAQALARVEADGGTDAGQVQDQR